MYAARLLTDTALRRLLAVDGPLWGSDDTVYYVYNEGVQLTGMIGPDPDGGTTTQHRRAERYTYNANGQVTQADVGTVTGTTLAGFAVSQSSHATYDGIARPISAELRVGATKYSHVDTSYDAGSRVTCTAVRMNVAHFGTQPNACALDTEGGDGPDRIARLVYDDANRSYGDMA